MIVGQIQQMEENEKKNEGSSTLKANSGSPTCRIPATLQAEEVTYSPAGIIRDWHASPTKPITIKYKLQCVLLKTLYKTPCPLL